MDTALFHQALAENSTEGIFYIDAQYGVRYWNCALDRMTGVDSANAVGQSWHPAIIDLRLSTSGAGQEVDCPIRFVLNSGEQCIRRAEIRGRGGQAIPVNVHCIPAISRDGAIHGAVIIIRDVSSELSLEARCQRLHELATRDSLTQVANRAELDRVHALLLSMHAETALPYSVMMIDIDHFKSINDTYGHPAGDEVIKNAARLLKSFCRLGDLAGRYGGEEFAVLLADCCGNTATHRAEEIRRTLAATPQAALGGKTVTASFGVTELSLGETADEIMTRADRALLIAKERNRNQVVYLRPDNGGRDTLAHAVSELRHALAVSAHQSSRPI